MTRGAGGGRMLDDLRRQLRAGRLGQRRAGGTASDGNTTRPQPSRPLGQRLQGVIGGLGSRLRTLPSGSIPSLRDTRRAQRLELLSQDALRYASAYGAILGIALGGWSGYQADGVGRAISYSITGLFVGLFGFQLLIILLAALARLLSVWTVIFLLVGAAAICAASILG